MNSVIFEKLIWHGFYSFGDKDTEFEFKPGFCLISGRNGAGKSSFMNMVSLCLFDKSPSVTKKDAVNSKVGEGCIRLIFSVDGKVYEVTYIRKGNDFTWVLSSNGDKVVDGKETGSYIEKLVGFDYNQFVNAFYLTQSGSLSMRMVYGAPAERLDILSKLFGLEKFDAASQNAKEKTQEFAGHADALDRDVRSLQGELVGIESQPNSDIEIEEAEKSLKDLAEEKARLGEEHDALMVKTGVDGALLQKEIDEINDEIRRKKTASLEKDRKTTKLGNDMEKLQEEIDDCKIRQERLPGYEVDKEKRKEFEAKIDAVKTDMNAASVQQSVWQARINDANNRSRKLMSEGGTCDKCGSEVSTDQLQVLKDTLAEEIALFEINKKKESQIEKGHDDQRKVLVTEYANILEWIRDFERTFSRDCEPLEVLQNRWDEIRKEFSQLQESWNEEVEIEALEKKKEGKLAEMLEVHRAEDKVEFLRRTVKDLEYRETQCKARLSNAQKVKTRIAEINQRLTELNETMQKWKTQADTYKFWIQGFKDLEVLKLCDMVETINAKMKDLLSRFGIECWLDVFEEKKTAKNTFSLEDFKRRVNLFVRADGKEKVPIEAYSGGEKQLIALGLVMAMGAAVSNLNYLGLDEVFGSLDETNREAVISLLEDEKKSGMLEGKTVVVVSHDDDIKSGIDWDRVVVVEKDDNGSTMREAV